jgi:hypothetical protein
VHGFSAHKTEILVNTVASLGGLICHSLDEVTSTSGAQLAHRFLIVPQTSTPDTQPKPPGNVHIITEFYIERCLHKKYFFDPSQHVIGRPFPVFPIAGFEGMSICTAGFTGVDLNQVDKSIRQLGAKYEERFTANASLLVSPSLPAIRKQKLELALAWKVPVVSADWLWESISTGRKAPIKRFLFPELKQSLENAKAPTQTKEVSRVKDSAKDKQERPFSRDGIDEDLLPKPATTKPKQRPELDESAFITTREETEEPVQRRKGPPTTEHDSNVTTTTHFETAPTHINPTDDMNISFGKKNLSSGAPLSEASSNSLNKSQVTPRGPDISQPRKSMSRIASEVADSEATEGDVGHPQDIPLHENEENREKSTESREVDGADRPDPEAEQKRLEAEKAAAERLAISTKLVTSLLDSTTAKLASTVSAPAALTAMSPAGADPAAGEDGRPKRRKRNILGRAISNVSAASSASGGGTDASAAAAAPLPLAGLARSDSLATGIGSDAPPAATQLEYEDPEARRYKEQLMNKMMGKAGGGGTMGRSFSEPRPEKLTLAGLGGYDLPQQRYDAVAGGERRTRRR